MRSSRAFRPLAMSVMPMLPGSSASALRERPWLGCSGLSGSCGAFPLRLRLHSPPRELPSQRLQTTCKGEPIRKMSRSAYATPAHISTAKYFLRSFALCEYSGNWETRHIITTGAHEQCIQVEGAPVVSVLAPCVCSSSVWDCGFLRRWTGCPGRSLGFCAKARGVVPCLNGHDALTADCRLHAETTY